MDDEHRRIYCKALDLSEQVGSEERMLRIIIKRMQSISNPCVTSPCEYWRVTVTIPSLEFYHK